MAAEHDGLFDGTFTEETKPAEVLRELAGRRVTGVLRTETRLGTGQCWLRNGEVIDAALGTVHGELALRCMVGVRVGRYVFETAPVVRDRSINRDTEDLIGFLLKRDSGWLKMVEQLPALGTRLVVNRARIGMAGTRLEPGDKELLELATQGLSVFELVAASEDDPLDVLKRVTRLVEHGFVRATASTRPEDAPKVATSSKPPQGRYSVRAGEVVDSVMVAGSSKPPRQSSRPPGKRGSGVDLANPKIPSGAGVPRELKESATQGESGFEPVPAAPESLSGPGTVKGGFEVPARSPSDGPGAPAAQGKAPGGGAPTGVAAAAGSLVPTRVVAVEAPKGAPPNQHMGRTQTLVGGHAVPPDLLRRSSNPPPNQQQRTAGVRTVSIESSPPGHSSSAPPPAASSSHPPPAVSPSSAPPPPAETPAAVRMDANIGFGQHKRPGPSQKLSKLPTAKRLELRAPFEHRKVAPADRWVFRVLTVGFQVAGVGCIAAGAFERAMALSAVGALLTVISLVSQLVLIYRMWGAVQDDRAPFSARRAVLLLFIPVFSFYWIFRVWPGFPTVYNAFLDRHQIDAPELSKHKMLAAMFIPAIGTVIHWIVVGQICQGITAISRHYRAAAAREGEG